MFFRTETERWRHLIKGMEARALFFGTRTETTLFQEVPQHMG